MKFGQFMSITKEKLSKNSTKKFLKTSSRTSCLCKELSTVSIGKSNLENLETSIGKLNQATYIKHLIAKLLKFVQISMVISS